MSDRLSDAFGQLSADERQLLTAALAGNFPPRLTSLRRPVITGLARADRDADASRPVHRQLALRDDQAIATNADRLVAQMTTLLEREGVNVVDVKRRGLLIETGGYHFMLGVQECE